MVLIYALTCNGVNMTVPTFSEAVAIREALGLNVIAATGAS